MANVILRKNSEGQLVFYLPKKDLEEVVVELEHDLDDKWGGHLTLGDGEKFYFDPLPERPSLPKTLRMKRVSD